MTLFYQPSPYVQQLAKDDAEYRATQDERMREINSLRDRSNDREIERLVNLLNDIKVRGRVLVDFSEWNTRNKTRRQIEAQVARLKARISERLQELLL